MYQILYGIETQMNTDFFTLFFQMQIGNNCRLWRGHRTTYTILFLSAHWRKNKRDRVSLCFIMSYHHIKSWSLLYDDKNQIERGKKEKKDKQRRRESERKDRKGPQSRFERSKGRKNRRKKVKAMTQKLGKRKWRVPIRFRIINHYTKVLFNFDIW